MLALIDGDIVAWKAAASTERTEYNVGDEHFRYKREAEQWAKAHGLEVEAILPETVKDPIEFTLSNIDSMMETILTNVGATEYEVYLTGKGNYRHSLAKTKPYKGNRTKPKPSNYPDALAHLQERWGAITVHGMEADDMLGVRSQEVKPSVICSTDKDLRMIPGLHYHLDKQEMDEVGEVDAWRSFYKQVLVGDTTDNIPGLPGCGIKTAEKLLDPVEDPHEMYLLVKQQYEEVLGEESGVEMLLEMADLLWIQRESGKLWQP